MKLFNVIIVYDVFTAAETPEDAMASTLALIRASDEPEEPSQQTALETTTDKGVRTAWREKRPIVGATVSDDDFEKLKGKTCVEVRAMIYSKSEPKT